MLALTRRTPAIVAAGAALGLAATGAFDESAAEIVTFHAATQRAFVVNALSGAVDVLDLSDPSAPVKVATL